MENEKKTEDAKNAQATSEPKATEPQKVYTQKDMLLYCGISALLTGVIGYFIGESRGEKKAKEKYEFAINEWQKKTRKQEKKKNGAEPEDSEEEFRL
ncbi:MAG: hypothetical protein IPO32_13125 [Crocinitomicaceae bacterium]|jgi:hypothetical protein|nr:hypothetical protein [Crocinitomicaceae bacterium]MBK9592384.1 hypothetical protein [Crocinitomicaceae bacterium]